MTDPETEPWMDLVSSPRRDRMPDMTKGLIPLPPHKVRLITTKPEGVGWNDLGKREVFGETLGSLFPRDVEASV